MKVKLLLTAALITVLSFSALTVFSQPPPPPPAGAPIDGGSLLLVAGIAAYGYKRIKDSLNRTAE